jgi:hypothetical protein
MLDALGFDSLTSYVWIHHFQMKDFPKTSYSWSREEAKKAMYGFLEEYDIPYYPNVTMGWDATPRTIQNETFEQIEYPYIPIMEGNTPGEFKKSLEMAKEILDRPSIENKILTINAWNEWTEGSYLEPDTINGMGYLEAIRDIFMISKQKRKG